MNREELAQRHTAAITRWWVTMRDSGKVPQQLLDDLAGIAEDYAASLGRAANEGTVPPAPLQPPGSGSTTAVDPGRVVSKDGAPPLKASSPGPLPQPSARTRARTRGGTG